MSLEEYKAYRTKERMKKRQERLSTFQEEIQRCNPKEARSATHCFYDAVLMSYDVVLMSCDVRMGWFGAEEIMEDMEENLQRYKISRKKAIELQVNVDEFPENLGEVVIRRRILPWLDKIKEKSQLEGLTGNDKIFEQALLRTKQTLEVTI